MKLFIIPKPVLNHEMVVMSYFFRFQKANEYLSNHPARIFDGAMSSPCLDILKMVGFKGFTNGLPIFVPLNKVTLLTDIERQCPEPPDKIIFLLNEKTLPEEPFIRSMKRLRDLGYRLALEDVSNYAEMSPVIELCDFIFISCTTENYKEALNSLTRRYRHLSCIASDVNDMDIFGQIKYKGFHLFEGKFYSGPVTKGQNTIAPIKVNRIQLLNIVRNANFEIEEVVKVVGQDPSLAISLLKFVNSPYLGLSQKIKTIQHAVAMLGQKEVRKWVTTAVSGALADDKPDEITRLSLMRAKFAENLAVHFEMAVHASSLFLMGLFSILDAVLEMPMGEALKIVAVSDKIHDALVYMKGDFSKVLSFIYAYETADWNEVYRLIIIYSLNVEDVFNAYIDTVRWYGSIISDDIQL